MELDKKDRLLLSFLMKILEKLYPEEGEFYFNHRKAIEEGYALHYSWLFEGFDDELNSEDCREVLDVLAMYRSIIFSYKKLSEEDKKDVNYDKIKFPGFDGNEESKRMSYVEYFIEDLDRYKEIKEITNGYYNSHAPKLSTYKRMLKKFNSLEKQTGLMSKEQLISLLESY